MKYKATIEGTVYATSYEHAERQIKSLVNGEISRLTMNRPDHRCNICDFTLVYYGMKEDNNHGN